MISGALGVTSYVHIPDHPRSAEEFEVLGRKLFNTNIPLLKLDGTLEDCWLWQYVMKNHYDEEFTHSVADNPAKNSVPYLMVQAQKSELLAIAARKPDAPDVLVWIDYGIFHIPGVTCKIIEDFMQRAQNERAIAIPGCWGRNYEYDDRYPCWRFCGGVIVMPRKYAEVFDAAMKDEYKRWLLETRNLSWEVNTMARVEQRYPELPIWWYHADHNEKIFTAYATTEAADGWQRQAVRGLQERHC